MPLSQPPFLFNRSRSFAVTFRFRASYIWMERSSVGQTGRFAWFSRKTASRSQGKFPGSAGMLALVSRSLPETRRQGCLRFQDICPTFFSAGVFIYGAEAIYGIISRRAINLPACLGADAHAASSAKGRKVPKRG